MGIPIGGRPRLNLAENDRIIAAFVGAFNDQIGPALEESGYVAISPIASAPDFEHLEAEGKTILGARLDLSSHVGAGALSTIQALDAVPGAPILAWPAIDFKDRWPPLSAIIEAMQQLNPTLDLRIVHDRHGVSYLRHALSSRDVFTMILPHRAPDYLTTALTEKNETRRRIHLNGEWTNIDPTRIERTVDGHLFIRPCSSEVRTAGFSLGKALVTHFGNVDNVYPGWCLLPEADGEEFFEFEWSYWPEGIETTAERRPDGKWRKNREFWSVLPGGFFGIRGRHDISRSAYEARCQRAIDMGVTFCVMIDQEAHDLTAFRAARREHVAMEAIKEWSLREIPEVRWKPAWLGDH